VQNKIQQISKYLNSKINILLICDDKIFLLFYSLEKIRNRTNIRYLFRVCLHYFTFDNARYILIEAICFERGQLSLAIKSRRIATGGAFAMHY